MKNYKDWIFFILVASLIVIANYIANTTNFEAYMTDVITSYSKILK